MKCQAIDPACQEEAVKAVKMTRGSETRIDHLCQRHYNIRVSILGPYPSVVTMKNPWGDDEREIARVEDVEMPLQGVLDG